MIEFREPEDNEYVGRYMVGSPLYSAITAKPGNRVKAFFHQTGHGLAETGKGLGIGAAGGAAIGGAASLLSKGKLHPSGGLKIGGAIGAGAGFIGGTLKGNYDKRSTEIMRQYR